MLWDLIRGYLAVCVVSLVGVVLAFVFSKAEVPQDVEI